MALKEPEDRGGAEVGFRNVYLDEARARAYASLEFPGTYYLAFRDLPTLLERHVTGTRALDFGCGAGRSTRFLKGLGYEVLGVDVSEPMLRQARSRDPEGHYLLVPDGELGSLAGESFDLVLSSLTFDNIPTWEKRASLLLELRGLLVDGGRMVNLVSSPELYTNEWVSLSPRNFPENETADVGDTVRIVILDESDQRPVDDVLWTDEAYRELYGRVGLEVVTVHRPLGGPSDRFEWVSEDRISPWAIYILTGSGSKS